jgi:hypothetical protein
VFVLTDPHWPACLRARVRVRARVCIPENSVVSSSARHAHTNITASMILCANMATHFFRPTVHPRIATGAHTRARTLWSLWACSHDTDISTHIHESTVIDAHSHARHSSSRLLCFVIVFDCITPRCPEERVLCDTAAQMREVGVRRGYWLWQ